MPMTGHEVVVNALPQCQFCKKNAAYDGRTKNGPWAFMCEECWVEHGVGQTGTGYGQRLVLNDAPIVVVCGRCMFCNERSELAVATQELADAINAWRFAPAQSRPYVQVAFPQLDADAREQILTGTHGKCWDSMFEETDDEPFGNDRD
jgi:hypothetical protein